DADRLPIVLGKRLEGAEGALGDERAHLLAVVGNPRQPVQRTAQLGFQRQGLVLINPPRVPSLLEGQPPSSPQNHHQRRGRIPAHPGHDNPFPAPQRASKGRKLRGRTTIGLFHCQEYVQTPSRESLRGTTPTFGWSLHRGVEPAARRT